MRDARIAQLEEWGAASFGGKGSAVCAFEEWTPDFGSNSVRIGGGVGQSAAIIKRLHTVEFRKSD